MSRHRNPDTPTPETFTPPPRPYLTAVHEDCADALAALMATRPQSTARLWKWEDDALCAEIGDDPFFPKQGVEPRAGKAVCGRCPVRWECLADALRTDAVDDEHGVRGGLTASERGRLRGNSAEAVATRRMIETALGRPVRRVAA